jgi:hypothetical protein
LNIKTCHKCGQKGRYANECKNEKVEKEPEATVVTTTATGTPIAKADDFDEAGHIHIKFLQSASYADHRSVVLNQPAGTVPKAWIMLDNQSTAGVFYNKELLKKIHRSETHMDIHCNAGITSTNLIGDLPGYGKVWYHPNDIANILSLARVKENTQSHVR